MKISLSWSGGKDSALALHRLQSDSRYDVVNLHCVAGEESDRVPMHEVPLALIEQQAQSAGLPLVVIKMPAERSNERYEQSMRQFVQDCLNQHITGLAYGDIFLEDLKAYREKMLSGTGLGAVFPLWNEPTGSLIKEFVQKGFKTCICAADERHLDRSRLGETIDEGWIKSLKPGTDPCGENGEFHSFTYDGPVFSSPVEFSKGEIYAHEYPSPVSDGEALRFNFLPLHKKN